MISSNTVLIVAIICLALLTSTTIRVLTALEIEKIKCTAIEEVKQ